MTFNFIPREEAFLLYFFQSCAFKKLQEHEVWVRGMALVGYGPTFTLASNVPLMPKWWVCMEGKRKKEGEEGEMRKGWGAEEEGHTSRFLQSLFSSQLRIETILQKELPAGLFIFCVMVGLAKPLSPGYMASLWLMPSSETYLCTLRSQWFRDLLGSVDRDQSFSWIDFPCPLRCDLLSHTDSYLTVLEWEWLYHFVILIS